MDPHSSPQSPSTRSTLSQTALPTSKLDKNTVSPSTTAEASEPISISRTGQEIKQFIQAMAELPDVRKERIDQIQAALQSETYSVSSQDLAEKIIQDLST